MRKNYTLFNISSLLLILLSIFLLVGTFQSDNSTVEFEDPGLEQAVRDTIGKEEGAIELSDVELLQVLDATDYGIKSLEGIEALENLRELNLEDNFVESVAPLGDSTKLEKLSLRNNEITNLEEIDFEDILFLNIRDLSLRHNVKRDSEGNGTRLADLSLLDQMVSLRKLELRDNHIEDLSPLSNLRKLKELDIRENKFNTIEPLATLTQLEELNIRDNEVESLEPLRYLTRLTYLNIHSNTELDALEPISDLVNLETLIMRNVEIEDDGEFLKQLTNLQRFNAIDTGFETIDPTIIEDLRGRGALRGEVRPVRMLHTLDSPQLSAESGFYEAGFELEIDTPSDNNIYYTLDGSEPTLDSAIYDGPINIEPLDENSFTVVRAKALTEDNTMSETVTKSYFVHENFEERFDLPIFSLVTDPDNLFDKETGIYTEKNMKNRGSEWERPVHLDFFETDGSLALEQELGVRIHGGATRAHDQKSLRLYAKSEYDPRDYMHHDFFNGLEKMNGNGTVTKFKRLLLRNSGNDWNQTMFNDAFMQSLVGPLGTMDTQAYRPSIVFLNGEYYGIHNMRERFDEYYLQSHYDIDKNDLVILEHNGLLYRGSTSDIYHYKNMLQYIEENGLEDDGDFEYIQTLMDTENFRDYFAANIYYGNSDWPDNNVKFWRKTTNSYEPDAPYGQDGRWRWMLYDTDSGFYYDDNKVGVKKYERSYRFNSIDWVMRELNGRRGTEVWPNFLFRSLMSNNHFKNDFLNRMNDLINSYFTEEIVNNSLDRFADGIENEMPHQIERWGLKDSVDEFHQWGAVKSIEQWHGVIDNKRLFASERPQYIRQYIMEEFDIEDTITVNVENETDMGYVRLNTIDINSELPGNTGESTWSGTYFTNVPITLEAIPKDGYEFSHWEGVQAEGDNVEITPSTDLNVRAVFTAQ